MDFYGNSAKSAGVLDCAEERGIELWGENFLRLSGLSRSILIRAEQLALGYGSDLLKATHILQSMLEVEGSPISENLRYCGIESTKLHSEVVRANFVGLVKDNMARRDARPILAPELRATLRAADRLTRSMQRVFIEPVALLLALLESCPKLNLSSFSSPSELSIRLRNLIGVR
jgi:ATP-dependent Clp protease ATP-binding subunit ClpA